MGYSVKKDTDYDPTTAGGGSFAPIPAGTYSAAVFKAELGEFGDKSKNAGKPYVNVQFRIADGQTGANRRMFQKVGIFEKWSSGADNFTFFQFFAAVTGKSEKDFRAWFKEEADPFDALPLPSALEGRKVDLTLKIVADTYAYNVAVTSGTLSEGETQDDYKTNDVSRISVFTGTGGGAAATASPKVAAVEL